MLTTGARNVKPGIGTHHKHLYRAYEVPSIKTVYNWPNRIYIYNVTCFSLFGHPQAAHINYYILATLANIYIFRLCLCVIILITISMLTMLVLLHHVKCQNSVKIKILRSLINLSEFFTLLVPLKFFKFHS